MLGGGKIAFARACADKFSGKDIPLYLQVESVRQSIKKHWSLTPTYVYEV